jgi:hypothetical protein
MVELGTPCNYYRRVSGELVNAIRSMRQRLAELRREVAALEAELREAGVELRGKKARGDKASLGSERRRPIKDTSNVGWALKILKHNERPMHIDTLVKHIEEMSGLTARKSTIVSNLSRYVRAHDTFTRPAQSMYGLVEWEAKEVPKT